MVLSRIHDCFAAEVARTSTTPLLLLEHLSGTQEAELPPTGVYHSPCCCQSQCAGILCCGGSGGISASPAEIPLPEHKPTSPTAAAAAKDFSRIFLKLAPPFHLPSSLPAVSPIGRAQLEASWQGSLGNVVCSLPALHGEGRREWEWS